MQTEQREANEVANMWYSAHIVMYFEYIDGGPQTDYHMYENVFLVKAESHVEANLKGQQIGMKAESEGEGQVWVGSRDAKTRFGGVRKTIEIIVEQSDQLQLTDEVEVTYFEIWVETRAELDSYISGERMFVQIQ